MADRIGERYRTERLEVGFYPVMIRVAQEIFRLAQMSKRR